VQPAVRTAQRAARGGQATWGVAIGKAVTPLGVAGSQVEALMPNQEKQLHQQPSQGGKLSQQGLLEVEEGGLGTIVLAGVQSLIKTLVQLLTEVVERGWTRTGLVVSLRKAHGVGPWLVPRDAKQQPG